jgi:hypothetical protein
LVDLDLDLDLLGSRPPKHEIEGQKEGLGEREGAQSR